MIENPYQSPTGSIPRRRAFASSPLWKALCLSGLATVAVSVAVFIWLSDSGVFFIFVEGPIELEIDPYNLGAWMFTAGLLAAILGAIGWLAELRKSDDAR